MKKYEYVHLTNKFFQKEFPHRDIIDEYAAKGYSYAGYIPTRITMGNNINVDLIFEKEIDEDSDKDC